MSGVLEQIHIMAIDEAVKATNSKIISIELPKGIQKVELGMDTLIIVGSKDVSDSRRAIEVALEYLNKSFGDVYATDALDILSFNILQGLMLRLTKYLVVK